MIWPQHGRFNYSFWSKNDSVSIKKHFSHKMVKEKLNLPSRNLHRVKNSQANQPTSIHVQFFWFFEEWNFSTFF